MNWKEKILSWLDQTYRLVLRYPVAVIGTIFVVLFAVLAATVGQKFQIGGVLEKLWGKSTADSNAKILPPTSRVDSDGKIIFPGESDDKGFVQAPTDLPIVSPGVFSNPDNIKVIHPTKGEISIPLPKGVKNTDVSEVLEVEPDIYEIKNNDTGTDVKSILKKL